MEKNEKTWEGAVLWLREQPDLQQLVRDCYFDDPLPNAAKRYYGGAEWQEVRKYLGRATPAAIRVAPPGPGSAGKALDVGAGMGISSYALARDGWDVVALEPDPSDIVGTGAIRSLFQAVNLPIKIEQTWGESLPFPDDTFKVVHCRQVLHHARDLKKLGSELARVLKPGGYFIATRDHVIAKNKDLQNFLDSHPLHKHYGGEHAYRLEEYLDALRGGEIRITKVLNPFDSDINLLPLTRFELKRRIAKRLFLPWPQLIPQGLLSIIGRTIKTPGMLYSFLGTKA
jgi:SAM-dependent methyltransferase